MIITPTAKFQPNLVGTIGIRILRPVDGTQILARTTSGITEVPQAGTGIYVWDGLVPDNEEFYVIVWDSGGTDPTYAADSVGPYAVLEAPISGLSGTLGIQIQNAASNATITPRTTASIIEPIANSGIYLYTDLPDLPLGLTSYLTIWDTGGASPEYTMDEITVDTATPPVIPSTQQLIAGFPIAYRNVGDSRTPQEIQRLRRYNVDFCRRQGEMVLLKHRYNLDDLDAGNAYVGVVNGTTDPSLAKRCPACYDATYGQTREDCSVCYGVGLVSIATDDISNKWIESGQLVSSDGGSHVQAPKFSGFGPAKFTWVVQPDVPLDTFRVGPQGVLTKMESPTSISPWYPLMADNDLCINVRLDLDDQTIVDLGYRYILQQVYPQTVRGFGQRAFERDFLVGQQFTMNRLPKGDILYQVQIDR